MSLKNASKAGKKSFHDLNVSFGPPNSAKPAEEVSPRLDCLFSPHPEARHGSNDEDHEILDHVDGEVGPGGAGQRGASRRARDLPFPVLWVSEIYWNNIRIPITRWRCGSKKLVQSSVSF